MKEKNTKNYIDYFYEATFSAYDFLVLFIALNLKERKLEFDKDKLINYIIYCKENRLFTNILQEISLASNGIYKYSIEIDEAIARLKWARVLYTVSPEQDGTIFIADGNYDEELIKPRSNYVFEMTNFIEEFNSFKLVLRKEEKC